MLQISKSLVEQGINYAIPTSWWKKFKQSSSFQREDFQPCFGFSESLSNIDTYHIIDTMLVDYEEYIVNQLSEKSNTLHFSERFMSSMISAEKQIFEDYTLVSGIFYNQLVKHYPVNHHVLNFAFKEYTASENERVDQVNGLFCPRALIQIQIVLCTNKSAFLFVGFFPQSGNFLELVRMIIKEMGFIERSETRMIFLDQCAGTTIKFTDLPFRLVRDLNSEQKFIMVTNLLSQNNQAVASQYNELNLSVESTKNNANMENILQRIFDEDSQAERPEHKTISTGISTPLDFSMDCQVRNGFERQEYFVKPMLKDKTEDEIMHFRKLADSYGEGQLIRINGVSKLDQRQVNLSVIADEIDKMIYMNHKKVIKDKDA